MLALILAATGLLLTTALGAALAFRSDRVALGIGTAGSVLACAGGFAAALFALVRNEHESLQAMWTLPVGEAHVALDELSAFFLVCVFLVSGLAAAYGNGYLRGAVGKRRLAPAVVFFNLLVASMVLLVIARDGILFLIAWEVMSLVSFFLVTYDNESAEVRRAGMTYLIASHLGAAVLMVFFLLLHHGTNDFNFDSYVAAGAPAGLASTCFLLALVGFGTKAGFWPVHIWLPDAHPAAPSHVSALMSGVMIKMGIYGLLRALSFLGAPVPWWGSVLVGVGIVSGVAGVLHALTQHDLKRLLAYHSVENIGIIAMGLGIGLLGKSHGLPVIAFLGFAAALLHVLNHGLFKGLLFQAAGSVLHATGTRNIDCMGALGRRMPMTSALFLLGSVAICGLPPLNGFVSEWLVYVGSFRAGASLPISSGVAAIAVVPALALIGGLAAACFVKAFTVVFLGHPRSEATSTAREAGAWMLVPMWLGAGLCALIGIWPEGALSLVGPAAARIAGTTAMPFEAIGPLSSVTRAAIALACVVAFLAFARRMLLRKREVRSASTWGCGYAAPNPRMQYTAASFAQPVLSPFSVVLPKHVNAEAPEGFFPVRAHYEEHSSDMASENLFVPATHGFVRVLSLLRFPKMAGVQLYLVYVLVTIIVLLIWQLGGDWR